MYYAMVSVGRPKSKIIDDLRFELLRLGERKYGSLCKVCNKIIKSTAEVRLKSHRNRCYLPDIKQQPRPSVFSAASTATSSSQRLEAPVAQEELQFAAASPSRQEITQTFIADVNLCLAKLIYSGNIPLNIVDNPHFVDFVEKLQPQYATEIPKTLDVCTTLLDATYERCLRSFKDSLSADSVLLIEDWKNCACNDKIVVSVLLNSNADQAFLEAWYLVTEEDPGAVGMEKFTDMIRDSLCSIRTSGYRTNVYAVISNNIQASASTEAEIHLSEDVSLWHLHCNSYLGNLLAADIINRDLNAKVVSILEEFNQTNFERLILDMGGRSVKLPRDTECCFLYRNAYKCLLDNLRYITALLANPHVRGAITEGVAALITDENFIQEVRDNLELLEPIYDLIKRTQSRNVTAADAAAMWLNLHLPEKFKSAFSSNVQTYTTKALSVYALTAYFLHPHYDKAALTSAQRELIYTFLFKHLDGSAIEDSYSFVQRKDFFKQLYEKDIRNPLAFWSLAEIKSPALAKLAAKLLQLPATSVQVRETFPLWAYGRSESHNSLNSEQYRKLLYNSYMLATQDASIDSIKKEQGD